MVTYNEYLKNLLLQILDSYKSLKEPKNKPDDLDVILKELSKINGFIKVILNKVDPDKITSPDYKIIKAKLQYYSDNYFFIKEIETMTPLYSNDTNRVNNMRLKILEALESRKMLEDMEELIEKI